MTYINNKLRPPGLDFLSILLSPCALAHWQAAAAMPWSHLLHGCSEVHLRRRRKDTSRPCCFHVLAGKLSRDTPATPSSLSLAGSLELREIEKAKPACSTVVRRHMAKFWPTIGTHLSISVSVRAIPPSAIYSSFPGNLTMTANNGRGVYMCTSCVHDDCQWWS
jgi:hypothetical protein